MRHVNDVRSLVILLVVLVHASVTYCGIGGWYVVENRPDSLGFLALLPMMFYNSFCQAWFMGIMFFFGGYFAREALSRKGPAKFARDRLARLGIPLAGYVFVINPLMLYFLVASDSYRAMGSFPELYAGLYLGKGMFADGTGPLWFAEAMLAFSVALALAVAVKNRFAASRAPSAEGPATVKAPGTPALLGLIALIGSCAFAIRIVLPMGTDFLNLQICYFAAYVILFAFGSLGSSRGWFASLTSGKNSRWLVAALCVGIPLWIVIGTVSGAQSGNIDALNGGGTWQSAAYAMWEAFMAVAMSIGLTAAFANRKTRGGALSGFLASNSFSVYVFHPPFLIALTALFRDWVVFAPLKALTVGGLAYLATLSFSALFVRRIPWVKKYF